MNTQSHAEPLDPATLKGRQGLRRILQAGAPSLAGLRAAYVGEAAFRHVVLLNLLLIQLAFLLDVSRVERAALIVVVLLAPIVGLLNSAIEAAVDRISLELHPLSTPAKDMSSAAQRLTMTLMAVAWAVILL